MLKPTISSPEDQKFSDSFPHLLLVHNAAQMEDFTPRRFAAMQNVIKHILSFLRSQLCKSINLKYEEI